MADNRLEFKIVKEANQQNADLKNLSTKAAQALAILIQSTARIVELSSESENVTISISEGSAIVTAEGTLEEIDEIETNLSQVIDKASTNGALVGEWRNIQRLFSANGLEYEANIFRADQPQPRRIYSTIKTAKRFITKSAAEPLIASMKFIEGKLIAVGGKKPNVHIEDANRKYTVSCDEAKAKKANEFLYANIRLSAWVKKNDRVEQFELCDTYVDRDDIFFRDLEAFTTDLRANTNQVQALKQLHYKCRQFLTDKDYKHFRKFLRLFIHDTTDVNTLNTILMVTQDFTTHLQLKELLSNIKALFDEKMAEYKRKKQTQSGRNNP